MKSSLTYDMHNYAAMSALDMDGGAATLKEHGSEEGYAVGEKYSLRQRQKRKYAKVERAPSGSAPHSKRQATADSGGSARWERHAGNGRLDAGLGQTSSAGNSPKPKTKAPPLSKYRRKTANARERTRMREINTAFETLRQCVPHVVGGDDNGSSSEKLTKITTLRLAMKYISILTEALADPSYEADLLLQCKRDGDQRFTTHPPPLPLPLLQAPPSEYAEPECGAKAKARARAKAQLPEKALKTLLPKTKGGRGATAKAPMSAAKKSAPKRQAKKQKLPQSLAPYPSALAASTSSESYASLCSVSPSTSSYGLASPLSSTLSSSSLLLDSSLNSSYLSGMNHSVSDISTMLLESDGESLHLSEHCLSPLAAAAQGGAAAYLLGVGSGGGNGGGGGGGAGGRPHLTDPTSAASRRNPAMSSTFDNPLELSLHLLESSNDSLNFSDHQPSACLSPLITLDTFNPFGDLLHSDLPEHTLDMFLT